MWSPDEQCLYVPPQATDGQWASFALVDVIGKDVRFWAGRLARDGFGADRLATFLSVESRCTVRGCQNPEC